MRIVIPTNDRLNIVYHLRFANGFMIFEIEDGKIQNQYYRKLAKPNTNEIDFNPSLYAQMAQSLTDCDLIILYAMNSEIENEFKKANIEIFLSSADLKTSVELFLQGRLIHVSKP